MKRQQLTKINHGDYQKKTSPSAKPVFSAREFVTPLLHLQHNLGNHAVSRFIQAKLKIGQSNDIYEQEADHVAEMVMRISEQTMAHSSSTSIQRECKDAAGRIPTIAPSVERQIYSLQGGGQPLPPSVRAFHETWFGADFSQVRVHTDARAAESAQAVNARAYTVGQDVVFGKGEYSPETQPGKQLLAHELAPTVQQGVDNSDTHVALLQRDEESERQPPVTKKETAQEKRQDVVIIVGRPSRTLESKETAEEKEQMEAWRSAAKALSPFVLEGLQVDQAFADLKKLKAPIGKLYIIGHADESGIGEVNAKGEPVSTTVEDVTRRMKQAAGSLGDRKPESIEMLACFGGGSPKTMGSIGEAVGASKVRAPVRTTVISAHTFKLKGKTLTAKDMAGMSDEKLFEFIQQTDALKFYDHVPGVPHPAPELSEEEKLKTIAGVLRKLGAIPFVSYNEAPGERDSVPYWKASVEKHKKTEEELSPGEMLGSKGVIEVDVTEE